MPVQLIQAAVEDLKTLSKNNRSLSRVLIKKLIFIGAEPSLSGYPLTGELTAMRKIKVGDRIWRIVWRVIKKKDAEVWGIGKRDHSEIYQEIEKGIKILSSQPETVSLAEVLASLRDKSIPVIEGSEISTEIIHALHLEMGLSIESIMTFSPEQAESLYERYLKKNHKGK